MSVTYAIILILAMGVISLSTLAGFILGARLSKGEDVIPSADGEFIQEKEDEDTPSVTYNFE